MARCVRALCDKQIVEHISMIQEIYAKLWIFLGDEIIKA
jgi:hypothetical protein